jgi:DNA-3-methyladenine glycosylase
VKRLPRAFYSRPTLEVLEDVIGKVLVHDTPEGRTAGVIVEAEAYIGEDDPACHAAPGPTRRNAPLYGPPGRAYVYLNYGLHQLVNAVTEPEASPAAILIRALEPTEGTDLMRERRLRGLRQLSSGEGRGVVRFDRTIPDEALCRGPGNLTVSLAIGPALNNSDLTRGALRIEDWGITPAGRVYSPRIGIRVATDRLWRCHWRGHASVSGRRGSKAERA